MAYFDCQIVQGGGGVILTVTCDAVYAGTTITATDGETTLTATCPSSSPYTVEFKLPNSGSWTISGTASGDTRTTTVVIPDSANLLPPVPTGATATPVNDIQTWLHCANVWNKTYTTITQVLADTSLVTTLIASNNAADYMARSTSWASSVTANSSAMTKIGANNYCANKLLANSTWRNAICNSTYFESVINFKIPTMTSNTSPSGYRAYGGTISWHDYYYAFDGVDTGKDSTVQSETNILDIRIELPQSIIPIKYKVVILSTDMITASSWQKPIEGVESLVQASNNNSNWTTIGNHTTQSNTDGQFSGITNTSTPYKYYRYYCSSKNTLAVYGNSLSNLYELQIWGRVDV